MVDSRRRADPDIKRGVCSGVVGRLRGGILGKYVRAAMLKWQWLREPNQTPGYSRRARAELAVLGICSRDYSRLPATQIPRLPLYTSE